MKKTDIDKIRDGMAQGSGNAAFEVTDADGNVERTYNIDGAAGVLQQVYDQTQDYDLVFPDDFPATQDNDTDLVSKEEVAEAQEAMQYFEDNLGSLLASFTGNDGGIEDADGNTVVSLPNAASSAAKSADLPSVSN